MTRRKPTRPAKPAKPSRRRGRPPKAPKAPTTPNGSELPAATTAEAMRAQLAAVQARAAAGARLNNHEMRVLRDAWLHDMAVHLWPSAEAAAADLGVSPNTFRGYGAARPDGTPGCPGIESHSPIPKAPVLRWLLANAHHQGGTPPATQATIEAVELSIKQAKDAKLWGSLTAEAEDRATQGVIEVAETLRHQLTQSLPAQLADQVRAAVDLAAGEDTARELIEGALRGLHYHPPATVNQTTEGTIV
jgi:uncharacterized protein (DUF2384 family)